MTSFQKIGRKIPHLRSFHSIFGAEMLLVISLFFRRLSLLFLSRIIHFYGRNMTLHPNFSFRDILTFHLLSLGTNYQLDSGVNGLLGEYSLFVIDYVIPFLQVVSSST